jgi:hypothetical protein
VAFGQDLGADPVLDPRAVVGRAGQAHVHAGEPPGLHERARDVVGGPDVAQHEPLERTEALDAAVSRSATAWHG